MSSDLSLRIIAITGQFRPLLGGTEVQAARLAREWAHGGHQVEIWTRRLEAGHPIEEAEGGAIVRRLGWASAARTLRIRRLEKIHFSVVLLRRLLQCAKHYDVVIALQALYPAVVAAAASCLSERPLAVRIASTGVTSDFGIWGALTSPVLNLFRRQAQAVVVMNAQSFREAAGLGFPTHQIHQIPNGLDPGDTPPDRPSARMPRVAYLGGLRSEKRVDLLLRAWARAGSPGELLLAGDGPLRTPLEALAAQLGISPIFLGNVTDPRSWLRDIDVFVVPSDAEGMSNALLEAMAEGCACIGTFVGGNIDCLAAEQDSAPKAGEVVEGSAGWLVGCGDELAMADALRSLCSNRALREMLGQRARERVLRDHSLQNTAQAYVKVFERLVFKMSEARD